MSNNSDAMRCTIAASKPRRYSDVLSLIHIPSLRTPSVKHNPTEENADDLMLGKYRLTPSPSGGPITSVFGRKANTTIWREVLLRTAKRRGAACVVWRSSGSFDATEHVRELRIWGPRGLEIASQEPLRGLCGREAEHG